MADYEAAPRDDIGADAYYEQRHADDPSYAYDYDALLTQNDVSQGQDEAIALDTGADSTAMPDASVEAGDASQGGFADSVEHIVQEVKEASMSPGSAEQEGITTGTMEVNKTATGADIARKFLVAALDPYILILVGYIAAVATQLLLVSRSALEHKPRKNLERSAVQAFAFAALANLATTWTFMFRYLYSSYTNFVEVMRIAGQELTSVPTCHLDASAACLAARTTAQLMRIGAWLQRTALFEEAWLMVVVGQLNWWWSAEVCMFTVGVWAVYVRVQGARHDVPHTWAYMLLGQTCAISVASSLFSMAIETRMPTSAQRQTVSRLSGVAFEGKVKRRASNASQSMPPPASPAARKRSGKASSAPLQPSVQSRIFMLACFLAGAATIYFKPTDLTTILAMHVAPLFITLPIFDEVEPLKKAESFLDQALSTSNIYAIVAMVSAYIRLQLHLDLLQNGFDVLDIKNVFFSTPAQSSISFDVVGIHIATIVALVTHATALHKARQSGAVFTVTVALALFTPILGPSVTLSTVLALEENRIEGLTDNSDHTTVASRKSSSPIKSARSSIASAFATPMKERISEVFSRRSSTASTSSAQKKTSTTPRQRKVSTSSTAAESAAESASESPSTVKKPAARRKASTFTAKPAAKTRGRAKKSADDAASATEVSVTDTDDASTTKSTTRKRSTATASRGRGAKKAAGSTASSRAGSRTRKASAAIATEDEQDDATSAASGTDVDGPANRTRGSAKPAAKRGRGGRRKAA